MASKPQGSSERVLPSQVIMDQLICAFLSHTHYYYWSEVVIAYSMLKVAAEVISIDYQNAFVGMGAIWRKILAQ